jgi:ubiquinone/menaquinone biosynthesis C-methylase UbiE
MSSQHHQSAPTILDRRTLQRDHRVLAGILGSGMAVLDVGCGTGAITRGIAEAVGPAGRVVGVDRDQGLLERARAHGSSLRNLRFEQADALALIFESSFDVVTAARTLQWVADPGAAIVAMARAAKPGGLIVVLDYNHALNLWDPAPPPAFADFYARFLSWREANGWDNEMANHLPALFELHGLQEIKSIDEDVTTSRGAADFDETSRIWTGVIEHLGPTMQAAGYCDVEHLAAAGGAYDAWRQAQLARHTLSMKAVVARVPGREATAI